MNEFVVEHNVLDAVIEIEIQRINITGPTTARHIFAIILKTNGRLPNILQKISCIFMYTKFS